MKIPNFFKIECLNKCRYSVYCFLLLYCFSLQALKTAEMEHRKPRVEDLKEKVEDSSFLNQLQNLVSKWIREIQKVTKLDRDPSNGTALQEISFWLNLERALLRIQVCTYYFFHTRYFFLNVHHPPIGKT